MNLERGNRKNPRSYKRQLSALISKPALTDAEACSALLWASMSPCSAERLYREAYTRSYLESYIALKKKKFFSFTRSQHKLPKELLCRLHYHKTLLKTSRNCLSIPSF